MKNLIIEIEEIKSIVVHASEKLNANNLRDFINTALKENNISITKEYQIFYSHLYYSNEYQISYFKKNANNKSQYKSQKQIIPFELFWVDSFNVRVFVTDTFFVCYINKELYYYQKIDTKLSLSQLKLFIEKRLCITVECIEFVNNLSYENVNSKIHINYLKKRTYIHTTIFSVYLLTVLSLFGFFYAKQKNPSLTLPINSTKQLEKEYNNIFKNIKYKPYVSDEYEEFSQKALVYDLYLHEFKMKKLNYSLVLSSKDKTKLYAFLKAYEKRLLKSNFQLQQGVHLLYVDIRFN